MSAQTDVEALARLVESGTAADRAYVDAVVRLARTKSAERAALDALHARLRPRAREVHAAMRSAIAAGTLRGAALRSVFDALPSTERDHVVEEVLDVAYPPLDELAVEREEIPYAPSGYEEIVHALDATSGTRTFVDLGAGLGKVVLLAALLGDRDACGIEREPVLHARAIEAAGALSVSARFVCSDVRAAPADADVVFMYLPFTGNILAGVLDRLASRPPKFLCAGAVDLAARPWLAESAPPRSWLHVYRRT